MLASAVISGSATSFLSALGIQGADVMGFKVMPLDWTQLMVITGMGGLVGLAAHLQKSPLPEEEQEDSQGK